jgi:hypothetical protein
MDYQYNSVSTGSCENVIFLRQIVNVLNEFIENTICSAHWMNHHEIFNSNVWYPGTEKIDAFSQFMGNDMNCLVLSPSLITKLNVFVIKLGGGTSQFM